MALEHAGEAVFHFNCRFAWADPDGAGNVGGAVQILPAAIDEIDAVGGNAAVGAFIDLIMAMRAIGASGRDGVERQILEHAGIFAECLQPCGGGQFVQLALIRGFAHPMQEPA